VRITATVDRKLARRLGLTRRLPKGAFTVASASRRLTGVKDATIVVRFTSKARARLRHVRRVRLALGVQVTEGALKRAVNRSVTLKR
jgi:hypothetical protein